jgi:hypothetical protein
LATLEDVKSFAAMLKDTRAAVEAGVKAGKSVEQLKKESALSAWPTFGGSSDKADGFIETLYQDVMGEKKGTWKRHN